MYPQGREEEQDLGTGSRKSSTGSRSREEMYLSRTSVPVSDKATAAVATLQDEAKVSVRMCVCVCVPGAYPASPYLQLGDDLVLGDADQLSVLHSKGREGDDRKQPCVYLLGGGSSGQHGAQDRLDTQRADTHTA